MKKTPLGCRNLSGPLAEAAEEARRAFMERFGAFGYRPFASSGLQLLEEAYDHLPLSLRRRLLPLLSPGGEPCVMRADITLAAIGHLGSRHAPEERPLRLVYADRIYAAPIPPEERIERMQVGAELLGWEGEGADAEVLHLLLSTLDRLGLTGSVAVLGDASLIARALAGLPAVLARSLSEALHRGDRVSYGSLLRSAHLPEERRSLLERLPEAKGSPERIRGLFVAGNPEGIPPEYRPEALLSLADALEGLGFDGRVRIDLGLCRELAYYSGPVFEIFAGPQGPCLGGGGRYDGLLEELGLLGQAVGFALDLGRLAERMPASPHRGPVVVSASGAPPGMVLRLADRIAGTGLPVECSWREEPDRALEWARLRGARAVADAATGIVRSLRDGAEEEIERWIGRNG